MEAICGLDGSPPPPCVVLCSFSMHVIIRLPSQGKLSLAAPKRHAAHGTHASTPKTTLSSESQSTALVRIQCAMKNDVDHLFA